MLFRSHKLFNAFLVMAVLTWGFMLYSLEHETRGLERQAVSLKRQMAGIEESINLLRAEWSSLTRPDRLQQLARQHLKLETLKASQIVGGGEIGALVPQAPPIKLEAAGKDPIGDILQGMQ